MPDFAKALEQLRPRRSARRRVESDNPVSSLARQLSFLKSRLPFLPSEPASLDGDEEVTQLGRHLVIRNSCDDAHYHGKVRLTRFSVTDLQRFMTLMKHRATATDRDSIVFLDTETTGIQGGTGMVPFLVGLGYFHPHLLRKTLARLPSPPMTPRTDSVTSTSWRLTCFTKWRRRPG